VPTIESSPTRFPPPFPVAGLSREGFKWFNPSFVINPPVFPANVVGFIQPGRD
jgi:hypothetical protein